jgi:hypothetical protein
MLTEKIKVFERHLGKIEWINSNEGFAECPGKNFHSARDGKRDCKIWIGPIPTVSCLHTSCRGITDSVNKRIRRSIFMIQRGENPELAPDKNRKKTAEEIEKIKQWREIKRLEAFARGQMMKWNPNPTWTFRQAVQESSCSIMMSPQDQYKKFLSLYRDDDVIWIGDVTDSGSDKHRANFRTVREWKEFDLPVGNFTCPSIFKEGSFSRSNANVLVRPYLAIESDVLTRDQMCSVAKWINESKVDDKVSDSLKMIVDTGGKSLHCWIEFPTNEIWLNNLKIFLPIFGCDPALFKPSQPVRIPGAVRDGRLQVIVWMRRND